MRAERSIRGARSQRSRRGRRVSTLVASALALAVVGAGTRAGAQGWDQLSPSDRRKAQEKYEIYKNMPRSRQQEIQRSYREWKGMGPAERDEIRRNYDAYRQLSPQERRAIGDLYRQQQRGR